MHDYSQVLSEAISERKGKFYGESACWSIIQSSHSTGWNGTQEDRYMNS
jgi:hypothetical protein